MTAPTPRPGILDISPYVGGQSSAPGVKRVIKLSSNESPLGPSPRAIAAIRGLADEAHRYPDGGATALREAIGLRFGLDPARIVCGCGSDELLTLLGRSFAGPGDEVLFSEHGFLMYAIVAKSVGATPVEAPETDLKADVDGLLDRVTERTRLVYLANPNNPTGSYLSRTELERLHLSLPPRVLLVVDAAYAEYVSLNDYSAGVELVDAAQNVVMTRTFSKIFGLAGLRVGWAYCPPAVADILNRVRNPFNVTAPAQAAAIASLEDIAYMDAARAHNDVWLPWLSARLAELGLEVSPSIGNFVLVHFPAEPKRNAAAADAFLTDRGILARRMEPYKLGHCLRLNVGLEDEMRETTAALAEFMK